MLEDVKKAAAILNKIIAESQPSANELLDQFIAARCAYVPGAAIEFQQLFRAFGDWAAEQGLATLPGKMKIIDGLPLRFPYGVGTANKRYIGNIVIKTDGNVPKAKDPRPWIIQGRRLKRSA